MGRAGRWSELDRAIDLIDCSTSHAQLSACADALLGRGADPVQQSPGASDPPPPAGAAGGGVRISADSCVRTLLQQDAVIVTEL